MKILLAHNYYQQRGGEYQVFSAEAALLEARGHQVIRYTKHNDAVQDMPLAKLVGATIWHQSVYDELRQLIRRVQPHIIHFHNTLPLISPSAYYAAKAEGVRVIQTLHNYRLACPNALFLRQGKACEDCLDKIFPWPGLRHACYQGSRVSTGGVAAMVTMHRLLGTWTQKIDTYITLSQFARDKFVQWGLPKEKIIVKPNFIDPDPEVGKNGSGYALFVGRLSPEKGINILLKAWKLLDSSIPLKIVGDGPLAAQVADAMQQSSEIHGVGYKPKSEVIKLMKRAKFLVLPSVVYENCPMTILEAYGTGLPVIASNHGSLTEYVRHGYTGLHFLPGDAKSLAQQINWLLENPDDLKRMRAMARTEYLTKYTAEKNYQMLMQVYTATTNSELV